MDGIRRLGANTAGSLRGIFPIFASLTAIIFLGEEITLLILLGTLSIILGVGMISGLGRESPIKFRKTDICIPILAAACFGLADTVRKLGLDLLNYPFFGAAIGATTAIACLTLLSAYRWGLSLPLRNKGAQYFVISGLSTSFALVALFFALSFGKVVFVAPLEGTSPLFVLLFSHIFLRGSERVTPFLLFGALLIVVGGALVTVG